MSGVQDALRQLQEDGFEVLYSSDLVPADLIGAASPRDTTALQRATHMLAQHGLELRSLGAKRFVVVRMQKSPASTPPQPVPELDEVNIFASRYALVGEGRYDEKLLDSAAIRNVPGAHDDPLRSLRSLPGIAATVSARPYIRGSLSNDVLVRYDGVTLLDPFHLKNFQNSFGAIDPFAVGGIDVYSSGYPVRFGTRSGGVIDITPPSTAHGHDIALTLGKLSAGVAIAGSSDRWPVEWLATARRNTTDLVLAPFDAERTRPRVIDATGLLRWTPGDRSELHAGWLLLDDRVDAGEEPDDGSAQAHYRDEYFWLGYRHRFEEWQARTTVSMTAADRLHEGELVRSGISSGQAVESRHFTKGELATDWTYEPDGPWSASIGAAIATTDSEYRYTRTLQLDPAVALAFNRPESADLAGSGSPNALLTSGYGSLRRRWAGLEAEVGVRLDAQDYGAGPAHSQWSPRLNLRYDLTDGWRVYGSVGRFSQAQAVEEWRAEELQQRADPVQNATHAVAGLAYEPAAGTRWSLEIYRKRWTRVSPYYESLLDPLALLPDLSPDHLRIAPDNSEASGLELSVRTRLADRLQGWAGVTVARVRDEFAESEQPRSWDQPLAFNAGLAWVGTQMQFSLMASWHEGWPYTPIVLAGDSSAEGWSVGTRNSRRRADYLSIDAKGSWTHAALGGDLTAFVEVTNATDQRNVCCTILGSPVAPGLQPRIETADWLPLIFNFGLTLRWHSRP